MSVLILAIKGNYLINTVLHKIITETCLTNADK